MGSFFSINSPFYKIMSKVFDAIVISLIYVVVCIPVITIGPATTALYYTIVKSLRRERGYIVREFFKSFKMNIKQGIIAGLIFTLLAALLIFNLYNVDVIGGKAAGYLWYLYLILLILEMMVYVYVFPILSRFTVTIKNLFRLSLFMAIRHLLTTLVSLVILAAGLLITWLTTGLALFFVPALVTLLTSLMMERVLKRYLPEQEEEYDENGELIKKDEWFRE